VPQGQEAHVATLTVHPAYTWLYPELLSQLARLLRICHAVATVSADYQPEQEYLEQISAS